MNTQNFRNGNNKFPLSTETLDFMQEQIFLVHKLTALFGSGNYILKEPVNGTGGLVVINGELLELTGTRPLTNGWIKVSSSNESITIADEFSGVVRTSRIASYQIGVLRLGFQIQGYNLSTFTNLSTIPSMMSQISTLQTHQMPHGAIVMWSGTIATIPTGWTLCNGQNGTPDLRGRFVVGASNSFANIHDPNYSRTEYLVGDTGGEDKHTLTASEINHNHNNSTRGKCGGSSKDDYVDNGSVTMGTYSPSAHENRPPYYALAYIMKII